ncbi:WXG100 family type VII secretion target [Nocardia sp. NPDC052566]|uniref:WXG100 family type VII secretion target n=1 Tax=Nocardia sp. NPDC052566 TaxID=3364330 RepID=UPI0037CA1DF7
MAGATQNEALVTTAKNDMGLAVDHIRATIQRIETAVDAARPGWRGDAFAAFNTTANNWHNEAERLKKVLDEITLQVGHGTKQFQDMESENENALNIY